MKRARCSITGKWVTLKYAEEHPDTTVVEEHPSPAEYNRKNDD